MIQAKDFITKEAKSAKAKKSLQCALSNFVMELKNHDYYADHFSRLSDREELRMCDGDGWFGCEGSFNVERCSYLDHHINPYGNREMRILFSTWDLDHGLVFLFLFSFERKFVGEHGSSLFGHWFLDFLRCLHWLLAESKLTLLICARWIPQIRL